MDELKACMSEREFETVAEREDATAVDCVVTGSAGSE